MRLTVMICTHDRAELLAAALRSLYASRRPRELDVDVLVVANACTDGTHALLDSLAGSDSSMPLRWTKEPAPGKSHALNKGIGELSSNWLAVIDDDHRVDEGFLIAIEGAINRHTNATLLCGKVLPDWSGSEPDWVHDNGPYRIYPLPIPQQDFGTEPRELGEEGPIPGGGNQIIRVDVLRQMGSFVTDLGPQGHDLGGGEDTEYVLRCLRAGERLWYEPSIVQYHYVDTARLALRYLVRKAFARSAAHAKLHAPVGRRRGIPLYLYRKLASHLLMAVTAWRQRRRRFYLVRTAAVLGEISAHRMTPSRSSAHTSRP